ncbi:MAG: phenylacetic acid degradation protein PaaN [Austwickia sp.]|nr:phenylacetic acid degradation protein PaaN [Austwickia sp.]MBK8437538.1 phenylacetic acid degradation protein PaaN [Austwickia sp.]MBK9102804.1 phenylacetic acid degradation protein PaaN [Austwickia sp.]
MHPLVDAHRETLEQAKAALASRSYYSAYPESPSPKIYGETAAADGLAAYEAHLNAPYENLASQPNDGMVASSEVSPYGPALGVSYPHLDLDSALAAATAAIPGWRDAGPLVRAAVCTEMVAQINKRSFEIANAVMHTSGQPFVMSFQAGGPHAQDRALESIVAGLVEQERIPESVIWEKPGRGEPVRMQKDYQIVPRGIALVIGCNTFPTWNAYPGIFASLATGNPVVIKPHPRAILPLAISVDIMRSVLADAGFDPNVVLLAPERDGEGLAKVLAERPEIAIIDYTGGPAFGSWLEKEAGGNGKLVYTEKAGINSIVIDSTDNVRGMTGNLAFSFSLYTGQMCTAPQNVYIPEGGIDTPDGTLSFDEVAGAIAKAIEKFNGDDAKAVEILGACVNDDVKARANDLAAVAAEVGGEVVLNNRKVEHPKFPDAVVRTPGLIKIDAAKEEGYTREFFGPVAFLIATKDTDESLTKMRDTIKAHGAMTMAIYSTSEDVLVKARAACAAAGVALSENLMGSVFVNQTAAFSDYHGTGANPAANAAYTDAAFVSNRFRVITSRRHI